mgnify:FL=1
MDGKKVDISFGEHSEMRDFFKDPRNHHALKEYLKDEKSIFAHPSGARYEIRKQTADGGKESFSVHLHHH